MAEQACPIPGWREKLCFGLAILLGVAAIYTAGWGVFDEVLVRSGFVGLSLVVVVLLVPAGAWRLGGKWRLLLPRVIDLVLMVFAIAATWRLIWLSDELDIGIYEYTATDRMFAVMGLIVLLELTRRLYGWPLFIVCGLAFSYALFGDKLPWIFEHAGFSWRGTIRTIWYSFDGVFGGPVAVVTSFILIFIVFGAVLEGIGAGAVLLKIAFSLTGRLRGGPAHAAVVASAMFGTISGSVSANVVGTGVFTIPMIRQRGFPAKFAGAVEAAASSGGQFMPPVMGAVAFIMADTTGIPYPTIAVAALVPAIFYYGSLFAAVSVEAVKQGIEPIPEADRETLTRRDWIMSLTFMVPLALIVVLMIGGRSPAFAGFWASFAALIMGFLLNGDLRSNPWRLIGSLRSAGENCAKILIAVAAVGIIIGVLNMTGLGLRFGNVIAGLAGGSLMVSLLLVMVGSLVLGMGMPTVPAYLIIVLTIGPAISQLGVSILVVHLFVVYFGVLSAITPPVAIAAYVAAPICGAGPMPTALEAVRVALLGFLIPFVVVYNPSLILVEGFDAVAFVWVSVRLTLAIWLLATGLSGFERAALSRWSRLARVGLALAVLIDVTAIQIGATGLGIGLLVFARQSARQSALERIT